jgi:hypothetical protein
MPKETLLPRGGRKRQRMLPRLVRGVSGKSYSVFLFLIRDQLLSFIVHSNFYYIPTCRYRKRKAADESSEEENDEEEDQFVNFSDDKDDEEEQFSSDSEEEEEINGDRAKLTVHEGREWQKLAYNARDFESIFQSGDGSKLFFTNCYTGRRRVQWRVFPALAAAQKSLVAEQDERSITLEYNFHRNSVLSQVPYRKMHLF